MSPMSAEATVVRNPSTRWLACHGKEIQTSKVIEAEFTLLRARPLWIG
jgi:hypothetical protein